MAVLDKGLKQRIVGALVLVGTSHPRDIDLRDAPFAVVQLLGDRDPIASPTRAERNRHRLPAHARRHVLPGANHSQFGDYGFQPGDRFAGMPRHAQRAATAAVLHAALACRPIPFSTTDGRR